MHLACRQLTYRFPGVSGALFEGLDWSMEGAGFFALFGLSGSGKTTLARILAGLIPPSAGDITFTGTSSILYAHNAERLPGWSTVRAHFLSVTPAARRDLMETLCREFGLDNILNHRFSGLSMGQKNRVNLVRYLTQDFDVLILDEVLANVDEPTRNHILLRTKALFPERSFLYISHNALEVVRFSKLIFVMPEGPGEPVRRLGRVQGLDAASEEFQEDLAQERIYAILKATAAPRTPT